MRITGGQARGIPLVVPKGGAVRPATDAMRQAVFSSLGARVSGARFLDLFAGSGAYGLEAFSRGAAGGVFVERDARTVTCIRKNITAVCGSLDRAAGDLQVINGDATAVLAGLSADIVFVDPPYEIIPVVGPKLFIRMTEALANVADPLVVFEMPGDLTLSPEGWTCVRRLGKGAHQPTACIFRESRFLP